MSKMIKFIGSERNLKSWWNYVIRIFFILIELPHADDYIKKWYTHIVAERVETDTPFGGKHLRGVYQNINVF